MQVTQVIYKAIKEEGKKNLLGYADIAFDESFVVKGLRLMQGKYGPFVSYPSKKGEDGDYYDNVFPITKEFRKEIEEAVLKEANLSETPSKKKTDDEEGFWE